MPPGSIWRPMSRYIRGDIVVVPFPFSGAPGEKPRPALVLAAVPFANRTDYVVCVISTQNAPNPSIIPLEVSDVQGGALVKKSYLRPAYLFTTGENRITRKAGEMRTEKVEAALMTLTALFQK